MAFRLAEAYVQFSQRGLSGVQGMVSGVSRGFTGAMGTVSRFSTLLGGLGIVTSAGAMLKLAADAEVTETKFRVLLKSGDAAKQMVEQINQFSNATPFDNFAISDAVQKLLAFGVAGDEVLDHLQAIGDISALTGNSIGEMAELYGKANVQGRLFMEDINQLTGRGIPIIQQLAKQFGVADSAVRDLVSSGQVTKDNLVRAFRDLTAEGGQFEDGMEQLSQTTAGKFSTMVGVLKSEAAELGQAFLPASSEFLDDITAFLQGDEIRASAESTADSVAGFLEQMNRGFRFTINHADDVVDAFSGVAAGAEVAFSAAGQAADMFGDLWDSLADGVDAYNELEGRPWDFADEFAEATADVKSSDEGLLESLKFTARNFGDIWGLAVARLAIHLANAMEHIRVFTANLKQDTEKALADSGQAGLDFMGIFKDSPLARWLGMGNEELRETREQLQALAEEDRGLISKVQRDGLEALTPEELVQFDAYKQRVKEIKNGIRELEFGVVNDQKPKPRQKPTLLNPDEDPEVQKRLDRIGKAEAEFQARKAEQEAERRAEKEEREKAAEARRQAREKAAAERDVEREKQRQQRLWKERQLALQKEKSQIGSADQVFNRFATAATKDKKDKGLPDVPGKAGKDDKAPAENKKNTKIPAGKGFWEALDKAVKDLPRENKVGAAGFNSGQLPAGIEVKGTQQLESMLANSTKGTDSLRQSIDALNSTIKSKPRGARVA